MCVCFYLCVCVCLYIYIYIYIYIYKSYDANNHHSIQFHHFMAKRWETTETVTDSVFFGSKITADGEGGHEIKICLLLGRKAMPNLDSILKSREFTLLTKVHLIKAMVFPVVMYRCESWTIKKAEC